MAKEPRFKTSTNRQQTDGIQFNDPTRTHQSFKEECDINTILKRYNKTGQLPEIIKTNPQYGDFSSQLSYQESLDVVMKAQEQFDALPSAVRERFGNDPSRFLAFANDPKSVEEMVAMGLATKREQKAPDGPLKEEKKEVKTT